MHKSILRKKLTRRRIILSLLLFGFFIQSNVAFAQTFRCKGRLIKKGDSKYYVIERCGEPAYVEAFSDPTPWGAKTGEKLYYESPDGRTFIIEIRRGEVKKIGAERK